MTNNNKYNNVNLNKTIEIINETAKINDKTYIYITKNIPNEIIDHIKWNVWFNQNVLIKKNINSTLYELDDDNNVIFYNVNNINLLIEEKRKKCSIILLFYQDESVEELKELYKNYDEEHLIKIYIKKMNNTTNNDTKKGLYQQYCKFFLIIKPEIYSKRQQFKVLDHFINNAKINIISYTFRKLGVEFWKELYSHTSDKEFYEPMCTRLSAKYAGYVVGYFSKDNLDYETLLNKHIGITNPSMADEESLRAIFGIDIEQNGVHCSKSEEEYYKEYELYKKHSFNNYNSRNSN